MEQNLLGRQVVESVVRREMIIVQFSGLASNTTEYSRETVRCERLRIER
ncbi:MAG TPA: hypothetical protein VKF36_02575 [Syntrophorhabdales bacterium]|nr:hypothetical protein [Syntrophorhabdales bacterium]